MSQSLAWTQRICPGSKSERGTLAPVPPAPESESLAVGGDKVTAVHGRGRATPASSVLSSRATLPVTLQAHRSVSHDSPHHGESRQKLLTAHTRPISTNLNWWPGKTCVLCCDNRALGPRARSVQSSGVLPAACTCHLPRRCEQRPRAPQ